MFQDDDFLLSKPHRRESVTALRIALMALTGCLALLSVLVLQARAESQAPLHHPASLIHAVEATHPAPRMSRHAQIGTLRTGALKPVC